MEQTEKSQTHQSLQLASKDRVRKNLLMLSPNERKQYFWCLKALGILPALQETREFLSLPLFLDDKTIPKKLVSPTCLHDQLIASHSTCCQHGSFFFAHYHRHLIALFQIRLNYADEVLRLTYDEFQKRFEKYPRLYATNDLQQKWKQVLDKYQKQIAPKEIKKVMAHYWNPTNYQCRDDLVIPEQVANPLYFKKLNPLTGEFQSYKNDQMDYLFKAVNGVYCYEINPNNRWSTSKDLSPNKQQTPIIDHYDETYQQMINGQSNPRNNRDIQSFIQSYKGLISQINSRSKSRYIQKYRQTGKVDLLNLREGQILISYGAKVSVAGKEYNYQYYKQDQIRATEMDVVRQYNSRLPHYQLAEGLFNQKYKSFKQFLDMLALEPSHNTMHDIMRFVFNDAAFSTTNLMFFPYHSWVDLQLEIKIRQCYNIAEADKIEQYLKEQANGYIIKEWEHPESPLQAGIDARNYILRQLQNSSGHLQLRSSLDLQEFYSSYLNLPENKEIYKSFKGISDYNASFEYEVFEGKDRASGKAALLGFGNSTYLPCYLKDMEKLVNLYQDDLKQRIKKAIDASQRNKSLKFYRKLVDKQLLLLVKYKSSVKNDIYSFSAQLAQLLKLLKARNYQLTKEQQQYFNRNIQIFVLNIFGRQENASSCPKCPDYYHEIIDVNKEVYLRSSQNTEQSNNSLMLWSIINSILLNKQQKDILKQNHPDQSVEVKDFINIKSDAEDLFQLSYIEGAEEVKIDFNLKSAKEINSFQFYLSLHAQSIVNASKKIKVDHRILEDDLPQLNGQEIRTTVNEAYNFPNLMSKDHSRLTKGLKRILYSYVHGRVFVNGISKSFNFKIRNYHEQIRYIIEVFNAENGLEIRVFDKDQDFKQKFFEPAA